MGKQYIDVKDLCTGGIWNKNGYTPPKIESFTVKNSGNNAEFSTGAQREVKDGKGRFDLISPFMLGRLAKHYQGGAVHYGDRNWEKGIPFKSLIDSALRHINVYREGDRTEDHITAAIWNLTAMIHFEGTGQDKELNDLPRYKG